MAITQNHIDQAYNVLKARCGGVRNDYFGLVYLEKEMEIPRDKAIHQVAFGGNDYGIDGFNIDTNLRNLYLFQFKWSASPMQFKGSFQRLIEAGMERIFCATTPDQKANDLLLQLRSKLFECQAAIDQVLIYFVFNGDPKEAEERSEVLAKLREDLEGKKYLVDQFFERPVKLAIQFRSANRKVGSPVRQRITHTYPVGLTDVLERSGPNGEQMQVGFVSLADLHGIFLDMGARFFERNIRHSLSEQAAPNRAIFKALKAVMDADDERLSAAFAFNHNGVTIYAEKLEPVDGKYRITEPRLLNGAQTVSTFDRFLKRNEGNVRLKERQKALHDVQVLCKFITGARPEFVVSVTINNNRQNPVMPWDLRANDMIQLELQDLFRQELGIYYQRQEGAFENLTQDELEELDIVEYKAIEMRRLAQALLASDGALDKLSNLPHVFGDDKLYGQVFNASRLRADLRHIVLCYKVQFCLRRLIREIMGMGETKYAYMARARNLVWALLCQAILNSPELESRANLHGCNMITDADYKGWLNNLASARVRFLVRDVVREEPYRSMIFEERYDFLRTQAVYDKCMAIASARWGWSKKRLS